MKITIKLSLEMVGKLKTYRDQRRVERGGKVLQIQTSILELLEKSLDGIEPKKVVDLEDLVFRVRRLEDKVLR